MQKILFVFGLGFGVIGAEMHTARLFSQKRAVYCAFADKCRIFTFLFAHRGVKAERREAFYFVLNTAYRFICRFKVFTVSNRSHILRHKRADFDFYIFKIFSVLRFFLFRRRFFRKAFKIGVFCVFYRAVSCLCAKNINLRTCVSAHAVCAVNTARSPRRRQKARQHRFALTVNHNSAHKRMCARRGFDFLLCNVNSRVFKTFVIKRMIFLYFRFVNIGKVKIHSAVLRSFSRPLFLCISALQARLFVYRPRICNF